MLKNVLKGSEEDVSDYQSSLLWGTMALKGMRFAIRAAFDLSDKLFD